MTARRCLPPLLALALTAPALSSCQLLGGGSSLDDALEVVPGEASQVQFVDRAAMAERLGVDDVETGADEGELDDYVEAVQDDPVGGTSLVAFLEPMQDAAFSELDVQWAVEFQVDDGPRVAVYKVDGVDLDELVQDLEDVGFAGEEEDGRTMLTVDDPAGVADDSSLIDGRYPFEFGFGVLVDPDEDLVVRGGDLDQVVEVLDDDADSLVDSGRFDDLVADEDVESAVLVADPPCGGDRAGQEQVDASGVTELGTPTGLGLVIRPDDDEVALAGRLQFEDDDAADADLEARQDYVEDGTSLATAQPVSDLGSAELERDGDVVRMELDLESPRSALDMVYRSDAFFACAP